MDFTHVCREPGREGKEETYCAVDDRVMQTIYQITYMQIDLVQVARVLSHPTRSMSSPVSSSLGHHLIGLVGAALICVLVAAAARCLPSPLGDVAVGGR